MARCFKIHPADNVATMLDDAPAGVVEVLNAGAGASVVVLEAVKIGHKVALVGIGAGEAVVKFGVPIGHAGGVIRKGEWVHLHNLVSNFDERSQTLDNVTGAPTDTAYT